jgi:type IV pilus assembly protein PilQ
VDKFMTCSGTGSANGSLRFARRRRRAAWGRATLLIWLGLSVAAACGQPVDPGQNIPVEDLLKLAQEMLGQQQGDAEEAPPTQPAEAPYDEPTEAPEQRNEPDGEVYASLFGDQPAVTINEAGLIDLHVREQSIATVLEMLSYETQTNIVTSAGVSGTVSANLYSVTLEQALEAVLTPNRYEYHVRGRTVFVGNGEDLLALLPPPATRVFKLKFIRPHEAASAVKAVLSEGATVVEGGTAQESGGGGGDNTDIVGAATDYLIVTDFPERLDAAAALLAEVDHRPSQVLIESTILRATLTESNQFGVDFTMLGGVDFENVGSTSNASADLSTGALPAEQLQDTTFNINTDFARNVAAGGFTFGLIKNSVAGFIRALEEVTDVVVVANPKLTALNKQEAQVIVGRRDGYLTTTVTETAAVQTVEFLETGTQIKFRPIINVDGTVQLWVHPKDSNGGLSAANLPFEETTEATAAIMVKDGNTVLIGGLFRERSVNTRNQLPLLGNIPWAGLLFGSRNDQTVREEVIILLTVHVLKESQAEQGAFAQLRDDIERVRIGMRRGLLGTGRERLAQAYYRAAMENLEAGERDLAELHARMTLHNQPKHVPAVKLLEQLEQQRLWDEEGTRMRTFIWGLIHPERGNGNAPGAPVFGRPVVPAWRGSNAEE